VTKRLANKAAKASLAILKSGYKKKIKVISINIGINIKPE